MIHHLLPELLHLIVNLTHPITARNLRASLKILAKLITPSNLQESEAIWRWSHEGFPDCWYWIARKGHTSLARRLKHHATTPQTEQFLVISAAYGHINNVILALEHSKLDSWELANALLNASQYGYLDIVQCLLGAGANPNSSPWYDGRLTGVGEREYGTNRALSLAAANGHLEIVQALLEAGADGSSYGAEAMEEALRFGHTEIYRLFNERGLRVWASTEDFRVACAQGYVGIAKYLLGTTRVSRKAVNECLYSAAENGHPEVVELLLQAGADVTTTYGSIMLPMPEEKGYRNVVTLLVGAGVKPSSDTYGGALQQ
ncbi:hypothetical protein HDV00_001149 [Rhizophlyctis rosea]|nr:hypothetical protein HDV00_001149 [Rhizophlyctis rosea]